jgi:hypothetical protein
MFTDTINKLNAIDNPLSLRDDICALYDAAENARQRANNAYRLFFYKKHLNKINKKLSDDLIDFTFTESSTINSYEFNSTLKFTHFSLILNKFQQDREDDEEVIEINISLKSDKYRIDIEYDEDTKYQHYNNLNGAMRSSMKKRFKELIKMYGLRSKEFSDLMYELLSGEVNIQVENGAEPFRPYK